MSDTEGIMINEWEQRGHYRGAMKVGYAMPKGELAMVTVINKDVIKLINLGNRLYNSKASTIGKPSFTEFLLSWGECVGR